MRRCARFELSVVCKDYMLIRDVGYTAGYPTITNTAEQVVKELAPALNGRRLYYIDSSGRTDELEVNDGEFAGFKAGGPI